MLSYLLLGTGLFLAYLSYRFFEKEEMTFVDNFINPYGPFLDSVNLDLCSVGGRDRLRWGSKLYVFQKGMIIGEPRGGVNNVHITLKNIKGLTNKGKDIIFYHKINGVNLPVKFELSGNVLQKKPFVILNETISEIKINNEVK